MENFSCLYCNSSFQELLPFGFDFPVLQKNKVIGAGYRLCVCSGCYSTDRERLLLLYLTEKSSEIFSTQNKIKLLHVAPEKNLSFVLSSQSNIEYIAGDKFPSLYNHYSHLEKCITLDITSLAYQDNIFDVIICNHVLEHIHDDITAMSELHRILKPGGWAILQVPISLVLEETYEDFSITSPEEREKAFGQRDHVRIYSKDYLQRLESVGFRVSTHNPMKEKWTSNLSKYGINLLEDVILGKK
ncbi:MAG: methyltransferase domain-containing protein [Rhizonema sp. PD37]|nr:methyltransferase domain-containing protein [Rhizonema sp. PD37]